jgi:hypothetical protein
VDNIFRRESGIYFARLVVPARLRQIIGKIELIASTGIRDLSVAKIVGAEIPSSWRRHLLELDRLFVDIVQLSIGSPILGAAGLLPLRDAAHASGMDLELLLREAAQKRLPLYYQPGKRSQQRSHDFRSPLASFQVL